MNIYEKLAVIQQKLKAPKNQYNEYGKYNYRSCEDILEGLKACLKDLKVAVVISDELVNLGDRYYIKATVELIDCESSEKICNSAYAREELAVKGMSESQITGSASSYARKYALNGLFCIDDVKDADTRDNTVNNTSSSNPVPNSKTTGKTNKESKTDERKQAEAQKKIENAKISDIKVKSLIKRCETDNIAVDKIRKLYKVGSISDLTEKQYRNISDNWEKIKVY